jgi:FkbM family methyltransferase
MFNHIQRRLSFLKWCSKTFASVGDFRTAMKLETNESAPLASKVTLHPRALGGRTIYCRPGTTDWATLRSVFDDKYHLPPVQRNQIACIVDLGANVGYTVAHFAYLYPQSQIFGVEMDNGNYALAAQNVQYWQDRINLLHAAIWSSDGEVTYNYGVPQDAYKIQTESLKSLTSAQVEFQEKNVPAISMNKLIDQFGIKQIDYLKVDIEGAEEELFLSPSSTTWLSLVSALKVEIHRPQDIDNYQKFLSKAGFIAYKDTHHWSTVVAYRLQSLYLKGRVK